MRKISAVIFLLAAITGYAQDTNKCVIDIESEKPMLIGYTTREAFNDTSFSWWFNSEYEMYEPDSTVMTGLKGSLDSVNIEIVMGSWCSDSRREIPRFFKILDNLEYSSDNITMISVDRDKHSEVGNLEELEVEFVPTIIFFQNGEELGRIVEMPNESLEEDMVEILTGSP